MSAKRVSRDLFFYGDKLVPDHFQRLFWTFFGLNYEYVFLFGNHIVPVWKKSFTMFLCKKNRNSLIGTRCLLEFNSEEIFVLLITKVRKRSGFDILYVFTIIIKRIVSWENIRLLKISVSVNLKWTFKDVKFWKSYKGCYIHFESCVIFF